MKRSCNEKMQVTIMLTVFGDGSKLTPNMILNCKTRPKEEAVLRNHCQIFVTGFQWCGPEGQGCSYKNRKHWYWMFVGII